MYSILTTAGPVKIDSPVQVATDNPEAALTITNNFGDGAGLALNVNGGTVTNGDTVFGGSAFTYTPGDFSIGGSVQQVYFPADGPTQDFSTLLSQIFRGLGLDQPGAVPLQPGPQSFPGEQAPGGGPGPSPGTGPVDGGTTISAGGGTGLVGIVKAGEGSTYTVQVYPSGFDRDPGPDVVIDVPNILATEKLPAGLKIVGIVAIQRGVKITGEADFVYYYQPATWLA